MANPGLGDFARENVYTVLAEFGVPSASRAIGTDPTEKVILLTARASARVDPDAVARARLARPRKRTSLTRRVRPI